MALLKPLHLKSLSCLQCCFIELDTSVETALMKDAELLDEQHQQLTELLNIVQSQNTQLRQLVSTPAAAADALVSSVDNSVMMASIGET